jgi:starch synthase
MYSLRYGTVPIVRETGGLADTIQDVDEQPEEGNGFVFRDYHSREMLSALARAVKFFADRGRWQELVERAMAADFSWARSAEKYHQLYLRALEK